MIEEIKTLLEEDAERITLSEEHGPDEIKTIEELFFKDKHFEFYQAIPSNDIYVEHNLNKYPAVTVVDSAGTCLLVEINHISKNAFRALPKNKITCKIYCN